MSASDFFNHVSIRQDEYATLPTHWRQALAEIVLRPTETSAEVRQLIHALSVEDIRLITQLAPYWTSLGIIRAISILSEHPIPDLSYLDMSDLESLGILESVSEGIRWEGPAATFGGRTVEGHTVFALIRSGDEDKNIVVRSTEFTGAGDQLLRSLRVNSNIVYFEWVAKTLEQQGAQVELHAIGTQESQEGLTQIGQGQIMRETLPIWSPSQ